MEHKMFSLLDIKAGLYSPPFFMVSGAHAVRAVAELGADSSNLVGRHPSDFQLVQLGTWDDTTGQATTGVPLPLGLVANLVQANHRTTLNLFANVGEEVKKGEMSDD